MKNYVIFFLLLLAAPAHAQIAAEDLLLQLSRMEGQIRQLNGRIEELEFRNKQLEERLTRFQDDAAFKAGDTSAAKPAAPQRPIRAEPHQRTPAAPPEPPIGAPSGRDNLDSPLDLSTLTRKALQDPDLAEKMPADTTPPRTQPPSNDPKDQFDLAYGFILRQDYPQAQENFADFLKNHPTHPLVPQAHYWLGEAFFQRGDYRQAGQSFLTLITKHAQAPKAPEAMLRLGQSLAGLNEKDQACATLAQVTTRFPQASSAIRASVDREQKRLKC